MCSAQVAPQMLATSSKASHMILPRRGRLGSVLPFTRGAVEWSPREPSGPALPLLVPAPPKPARLGSAKGPKTGAAKMSVGIEGLKPDDKVGILLLNLGGPEKLSEVSSFLFNLFNDEDIIRLPGPVKPLQPLIARYIASSRAPSSQEKC